MTPRQEKILNRIIKEYVRTATPVGSEFLLKKQNFDICSATVRNEMKALTEMGYLFQPHKSSGRVPTSKGYRFFVNNLLSKSSDNIIDDILENGKPLEEDEIKVAEVIIKNLAISSSGLVFAYLIEKDIFLSGGWNVVLKNPEFEEKDFLDDFLLQFETLEKKIKETIEEFEDFDICIGKEKSIIKYDNLTLIISKSHLPRTCFGILGPSRMAYDKNINLILRHGKIKKGA